ncbi:class I SAM-dependent methyltransferase [Neobacillus cucumis]|uniref:class I SAM-dependent methyltransferase n=1 Tax=Neobacillus cucumis TaxID=1740721 RepID=UPI0019669CC0|nr:class I SAM-dependent methyltransferase [Neobacillus cucumis]MBM7655019.1 ubiquinone/menaquinone biosynthesis C-methylase UbiE [Neobacillus cucumis]MED4229226.1 class I SAM-dependent methyltransferase [Neobacillus cucumis]
MGGLTYFDFLAKFGVGGAHPGGIHLTQNILSQENISEKSVILDAGCGTGQTAAFLYQQYRANVFGIEINPIMVEKAKSRFQTLQLPISLIQGSIEEVPFADNTFDFILSESVLAFVNKPKALQEFYRVLKKGGRLLANEMTMNRLVSDQEAAEIMNFYAVDSLLLEKDWEKYLKSAGFQNIKIEEQNFPLSHGNQTPEFNFSTDFDPELFHILNEHGNIVIKYQDTLSYRIITATK